MSGFDAIGLTMRGLPPATVADRLAEWARWPIDRAPGREIERAGKSLRVHSLDLGGGARLVSVVERKRRHFLPPEEIVCFYAAFDGGARREVEIASVETPSCPYEPVVTTGFPDRLRFRVANPFDFEPVPGARATVDLALLAARVESAPGGTGAAVVPASIASQDPELPPDLFVVAGVVEDLGAFSNSATGEPCLTFRVATPGGTLTVVARGQDAPGAPGKGGLLVAEGEFVAGIRALA